MLLICASRSWRDIRLRAASKSGFAGKFSAAGNLKFNDKDLSSKLQQLKARTACNDCQEIGHWAGDDVCRNPSETSLRLRAQLKETYQLGGNKRKQRCCKQCVEKYQRKTYEAQMMTALSNVADAIEKFPHWKS